MEEVGQFRAGITEGRKRSGAFYPLRSSQAGILPGQTRLISIHRSRPISPGRHPRAARCRPRTQRGGAGRLGKTKPRRPPREKRESGSVPSRRPHPRARLCPSPNPGPASCHPLSTQDTLRSSTLPMHTGSACRCRDPNAGNGPLPRAGRTPAWHCRLRRPAGPGYGFGSASFVAASSLRHRAASSGLPVSS